MADREEGSPVVSIGLGLFVFAVSATLIGIQAANTDGVSQLQCVYNRYSWGMACKSVSVEYPDLISGLGLTGSILGVIAGFLMILQSKVRQLEFIASELCLGTIILELLAAGLVLKINWDIRMTGYPTYYTVYPRMQTEAGLEIMLAMVLAQHFIFRSFK
eukprot:TRINITY_DN1056_c0_g1_i1.p1 TRINITY_DN1056_c0_g1~~TRINITY_DN1056_c0_g1_i1.p1  ORF type:complete len:167 (-),score=4.64 TRINITY_DN1056_c0_g1_i1:65-544(-)